MQSLLGDSSIQCSPTNDLKALTSGLDVDRSSWQTAGPSGSQSSQRVGGSASVPFRLNDRDLTPVVLGRGPRPRPEHQVAQRPAWTASYPSGTQHALPPMAMGRSRMDLSGKGKGKAVEDHGWVQGFQQQQQQPAPAKPWERQSQQPVSYPQSQPIIHGTTFNAVPFVPTQHPFLAHPPPVFAQPLHYQPPPVALPQPSQSQQPAWQDPELAQTARKIMSLPEVQQGWPELDQAAGTSSAAPAMGKLQGSKFFGLMENLAAGARQEEAASHLSDRLSDELQSALTFKDGGEAVTRKVTQTETDKEWVGERESMLACSPFDTVRQNFQGTSQPQTWDSAFDLAEAQSMGSQQPQQVTEEQSMQSAKDDFDQETFAGFYGTQTRYQDTSHAHRQQLQLDALAADINLDMDRMFEGLTDLDETMADLRALKGYGRRPVKDANLAYPFGERPERFGPPEIGSVSDYEAQVLKDPLDTEAWVRLGQAQQANERDDLAIKAFQHCISMEPSHRQALLGISVSYTNEGDLSEAHRALENWLKATIAGRAHGLVSEQEPQLELSREGRHSALVEALLERVLPDSEDVVDADVQIALGVLLNASEDYQMAEECFRYAVAARPNDVRLYNMLGATLANGGKAEEALGCYQAALDLDPGFIRAMFNVAVSCIKLSKYHEAVLYLVDALRLQSTAADSGKAGGKLQTGTSNNLWTTLESASVYLRRHDLAGPARRHDLHAFETTLRDFPLEDETPQPPLAPQSDQL